MINSTLQDVGTINCSFCKPSRGPTSTIFTLGGNLGDDWDVDVVPVVANVPSDTFSDSLSIFHSFLVSFI